MALLRCMRPLRSEHMEAGSRCPLSVAKRTSNLRPSLSGYDPKRTLASLQQVRQSVYPRTQLKHLPADSPSLRAHPEGFCRNVSSPAQPLPVARQLAVMSHADETASACSRLNWGLRANVWRRITNPALASEHT